MLSELFEWLAVGPFINAFRATTWILLPTRSPAVSWLKLAAGTALAMAVALFITLLVMAWTRPSLAAVTSTFLASIACCYLAGFFAMLIERVHRT
jgi:hypothetical protein